VAADRLRAIAVKEDALTPGTHIATGSLDGAGRNQDSVLRDEDAFGGALAFEHGADCTRSLAASRCDGRVTVGRPARVGCRIHVGCSFASPPWPAAFGFFRVRHPLGAVAVQVSVPGAVRGFVDDLKSAVRARATSAFEYRRCPAQSRCDRMTPRCSNRRTVSRDTPSTPANCPIRMLENPRRCCEQHMAAGRRIKPSCWSARTKCARRAKYILSALPERVPGAALARATQFVTAPLPFEAVRGHASAETRAENLCHVCYRPLPWEPCGDQSPPDVFEKVAL
jgi:hypothetical protein